MIIYISITDHMQLNQNGIDVALSCNHTCCIDHLNGFIFHIAMKTTQKNILEFSI